MTCGGVMICPDCGLLRHPGRDCCTKPCPDCHGEGEVERERTVGGYSHGNPWQGYDVYFVECERCGGWGEVEDDE